MKVILNVIGIIVLLGALYMFSSDKKRIDFKMIGKALVLQFILAFLLVKFPLGKVLIEKVSDIVTNILSYGREGLDFVFGSLSAVTVTCFSVLNALTVVSIFFCFTRSFCQSNVSKCVCVSLLLNHSFLSSEGKNAFDAKTNGFVLNFATFC